MELQACNYPISGHTPSPKDFLREYRLTHWRDMSEQHPDLTALVVNSEQLSWQERALCAQTDPEAFFPEKGGSTREAKRVCLSCEVRAECLEYALAHDERFGIWGGLSERERRRLKRRSA